MSERRRKIHQRACPLHFKRVKDNQLSRWAASGWQRGDKGYKYGLNTGWKVQSRCLPWGEPSPGKGRQLRKASCIEGYRGESSLGRSSPGKGRQMRKLLPASRVSLGRILPAKCESCFHKSKSSQAPYSRDGHRSKGAWSRLPQAGEHSIATHVETLERCRQAASQPARCISPHCPADWLGHRHIRFATASAWGSGTMPRNHQSDPNTSAMPV